MKALFTYDVIFGSLMCACEGGNQSFLPIQNFRIKLNATLENKETQMNPFIKNAKRPVDKQKHSNNKDRK